MSVAFRRWMLLTAISLAVLVSFFVTARSVTNDPEQMLTTVETAKLLGCSVSFLEIGRIRGYGPPAQKITPRMVRYRRGDVLAWVRERAEANARDQAV